MKIPEAWVNIYATHAVRGELISQALEAAEELGYEAWAVKSQSDGILVPSDVFQFLYPSMAPGTDTLDLDDKIPVPDVVTVDLPEPVTDAEIRAWAREHDVEVNARGALSQSVRDAYAEREQLL